MSFREVADSCHTGDVRYNSVTFGKIFIAISKLETMYHAVIYKHYALFAYLKR